MSLPNAAGPLLMQGDPDAVSPRLTLAEPAPESTGQAGLNPFAGSVTVATVTWTPAPPPRLEAQWAPSLLAVLLVFVVVVRLLRKLVE